MCNVVVVVVILIMVPFGRSACQNRYSIRDRAKYTPNQFQPVKSAISKPFEFGFEIKDKFGNRQSRHEISDHRGHRLGSYTVYLSDGRRRYVRYKADDAGFRAYVRSNEQGVGSPHNSGPLSRFRYGNGNIFRRSSQVPRSEYNLPQDKIANHNLEDADQKHGTENKTTVDIYGNENGNRKSRIGGGYDEIGPMMANEGKVQSIENKPMTAALIKEGKYKVDASPEDSTINETDSDNHKVNVDRQLNKTKAHPASLNTNQEDLVPFETPSLFPAERFEQESSEMINEKPTVRNKTIDNVIPNEKSGEVANYGDSEVNPEISEKKFDEERSQQSNSSEADNYGFGSVEVGNQEKDRNHTEERFSQMNKQSRLLAFFGTDERKRQELTTSAKKLSVKPKNITEIRVIDANETGNLFENTEGLSEVDTQRHNQDQTLTLTKGKSSENEMNGSEKDENPKYNLTTKLPSNSSSNVFMKSDSIKRNESTPSLQTGNFSEMKKEINVVISKTSEHSTVDDDHDEKQKVSSKPLEHSTVDEENQKVSSKSSEHSTVDDDEKQKVSSKFLEHSTVDDEHQKVSSKFLEHSAVDDEHQKVSSKSLEHSTVDEEKQKVSSKVLEHSTVDDEQQKVSSKSLEHSTVDDDDEKQKVSSKFLEHSTVDDDEKQNVSSKSSEHSTVDDDDDEKQKVSSKAYDNHDSLFEDLNQSKERNQQQENDSVREVVQEKSLETKSMNLGENVSQQISKGAKEPAEKNHGIQANVEETVSLKVQRITSYPVSADENKTENEAKMSNDDGNKNMSDISRESVETDDSEQGQEISDKRATKSKKEANLLDMIQKHAGCGDGTPWIGITISTVHNETKHPTSDVSPTPAIHSDGIKPEKVLARQEIGSLLPTNSANLDNGLHRSKFVPIYLHESGQYVRRNRVHGGYINGGRFSIAQTSVDRKDKVPSRRRSGRLHRDQYYNSPREFRIENHHPKYYRGQDGYYYPIYYYGPRSVRRRNSPL